MANVLVLYRRRGTASIVGCLCDRLRSPVKYFVGVSLVALLTLIVARSASDGAVVPTVGRAERPQRCAARSRSCTAPRRASYIIVTDFAGDGGPGDIAIFPANATGRARPSYRLEPYSPFSGLEAFGISEGPSLTDPYGVYADTRHDAIWVTDCSHSTIQRYALAATRDFASSIVIGGDATTLDCPTGIYVASSGSIYVSDGRAIDVFAADASGNVAPVGKRLFDGSGSLALDANGNVWTSSGDGIFEFSSLNASPMKRIVISPFGGLSYTVTSDGLFIDHNGNIWATLRQSTNCFHTFQTSMIEEFSAVNAHRWVLKRRIVGSKTLLDCPDAAAVDDAGYIYVSQHIGGVLVFGPSANGNVAPIQSIPIDDATSLHYPVGIGLYSGRIEAAVVSALAPSHRPRRTPSATPPPADLNVELGFHDLVEQVTLSPAVLTVPPSCANVQGVLGAGTRPDDGLCVRASKAGLTVHVALSRSALPLMPKTLACVHLSPQGSNPISGDVVRVGVLLKRSDGSKEYLQCDVTAAFALAQASEQGAVPGTASTWTSDISIPWSLLDVPRADTIEITVNACDKVDGCNENGDKTLDTTIAVVRAWRALSLTPDYAPSILQTPIPAGPTSSAPSRTHDIGFEEELLMYPTTAFAIGAAQSQTSVQSQSSLRQIMSATSSSGSAPSPPPQALQTLQTRSQSYFALPVASSSLLDPSLSSITDSSAFSFQKVSALASGGAFAYATRTFEGGAFYGLFGPGQYDGAYTAALIVPRPFPTPTPSVTISRVQAPSRPASETQAQQLPIAEIAFQDAYAITPRTTDSFQSLLLTSNTGHSGIFGGQNPRYVADDNEFFGSIQWDEHPTAIGKSGPSVIPDASHYALFGDAFIYTQADDASFFQARATLAMQTAEALFAPADGAGTAYSSLTGPIAHLSLSDSLLRSVAPTSFDFVAYRLTNVYGDLVTNEQETLSNPLTLWGKWQKWKSGWWLTLSTQSQSISDREAETQQGWAQSYIKVLYPGGVPNSLPVPEPTIRPENIENASLQSPPISVGQVQLQLAGGVQWGKSTFCNEYAKGRFLCATDPANNGTWGAAITYQKFTFQASTSSNTVLGNAVAAGAVSRYFGPRLSSPGSLTSDATYANALGCDSVTAGYTNAIYASGIPLPQKGGTFALQGQAGVRLGEQNELMFTLGYLNSQGPQQAIFNPTPYAQSGLYLGFSIASRAGVCQ